MIRHFILLALVLLATPSMAQTPMPPTDEAFSAIHQFYAQRDYRTIWTNNDRFTKRARALPEILAGAVKHGLDPEAYGITRMNIVLNDEKPDGPNAWRQAELFWTYGVWQYASDLMGQPVDTLTLENIVTGDIKDNLDALAPDNALYRALQERLAQINEASPVEQQVRLDFGRKLFKPGMSHPQVPELRARMLMFGAYDGAAPAATDTGTTEIFYDPSLAKAVGRFQHEYGLKDDGAIGPVTLGILNRDAAQERPQVIANMQRLREPHRRLREDKRIEVSIARFWLTAYEGGREALSMPVVVGQPRRQTISFRTEISGIRLNPSWTVPNTIKKEDFLPMLVSDPAKLVRKHGVKVAFGGKHVDPSLIDWTQLTPRELAQVGFWRPAGDGNPLGRYRIIMENPYDIYLHDTNHPELFKTSMRAQSSGCVRVADPEALAQFVLAGTSGWNPQKTKEVVKKGLTTDVVIENKIPIYLDYMTAWFNHRGQLILGTDVYALDKPRYDILVKNGLTTQRNAQKILTRVTDILEPELKEAHSRDSALTQSTN